MPPCSRNAVNTGLFTEQVGVGTGTGEGQDEDVILDLVDQQPVGGDVTFAVVCPVPGEVVVSIGGGQ